jgi:hypothetical protein
LGCAALARNIERQRRSNIVQCLWHKDEWRGERIGVTDATTSRDLSDIDAGLYPYLRLSYHTSDDRFITAAQLNQWVVTYTPGPEGLLYYNGNKNTERLNEGVSWNGKFAFINIGEQPFSDSLMVTYEVFNQRRLQTIKSTATILAPAPGDTTHIPINLATEGLAGMNDFQLFVNPRIHPEQLYSNNLLLLVNKIDVSEDALNPILEVTIDGRRVKNGEFVSPTPEIVATLWDENKNILKTDTTGIRLFLTYPCNSTPCGATQVCGAE